MKTLPKQIQAADLTAAQLKVAQFLQFNECVSAEEIGPRKQFQRSVLNKMVAAGMLSHHEPTDEYYAEDVIYSLVQPEAYIARVEAGVYHIAEADKMVEVEQPAPTNTLSVQQVAVSLIRAGNNDRKHFDENALRELADSIAEHGLLQPVTLRPMDGGKWYEIVAGERRFRAISTILNWEHVPAIVRELSDEEASALMLVENTARVDLDPIAEARAFQIRVDRFGWSEAEIAKTAGLSVERVKNRLKLLKLPEDVQHMVKTLQFPTGHAQLLSDLDKARQRIAIAAYVSAKSMPLPRFQEIVARLRADMQAELQMPMFELELMVMQSIDTNQFALRGKKARTGAPVKRDLPTIKVASTDTTGDILDRYVQDLQRAGLEDAAAIIGTMYNALVAVNCASVPVNSVLAKTGEELAGDLNIIENI